MVVDYREQILMLAQHKPLLPGDVAKCLNTNLLMASAMLSELSATKKLKVSKLKVGSSPLYFLPEKEALLQDFMNALPEKDRQTAFALQQQKVVRDVDQDPLTRVSLRQIGDFSRPVVVQNKGSEELFWKWFLLSDEDAHKLIQQNLLPVEKTIVAVQNVVVEPKLSSPEIITAPKKSVVVKDNFMHRVESFFNNAQIKIVEKHVLKRSECELVVELPSPVGSLTYYCRVRNKKKISDADVSQAFVEGQLRKLPVLIVTDGELNKKAKELLFQLKGVSFQKI